MKSHFVIIATAVSLMMFAVPASAQRTVQTEMVSMDLSGYHTGATLDLKDGMYRDRKGRYVVVKNKRVVEKGNDFRTYKSRSGRRAPTSAPTDVKSNEKPQKVGLLLPAVQQVREAPRKSSSDNCGVAAMKWELQDLQFTGYSVSGSEGAKPPRDGAYKTDTGGYAIVKNGRIVEKGNDWRKYRPKVAGGDACGTPARVR